MSAASPSSSIGAARARLQRDSARGVVVAGLVTFVAHLAHVLVRGTLRGLDYTRFEIGHACSVRDALSRGESTSVSTLLGNGLPFIAAPETQLHSPLRWLSFLFSPDVGATLHVVVYFALSASAAAALLRTFRVRPARAAVGGVAYAATGPILDLAFHGMYVVGAVALPLAWAGARAARARHTRSLGLVVVAVAVAAALLVGEPQAAGLALALVALEGAAALLRARDDAARARRARTVVVARQALAALGGALVGLFPWWSTFAELAITPRGAALAQDDVLRFDVGPAQLVGTVVAGLGATKIDAGPFAQQTPFGALFPTTPIGWIAEPHIGAPLLALVVVGCVLARARRRAAIALPVAAFGALLSLGATTPFFPLLLRAFPVFGIFRFPAKYLVVTALALVVIAAVACDALARHASRGLARDDARASRIIAACFALVVAATALVALAPAAVAPALVDDEVRRAVLLGLALAGLSSGALLVIAARAPRALLLVVALDLARVAPVALTLGPPVAPLPSLAPLVRAHVTHEIPVVCSTQAMRARMFHDEPDWRTGQARAQRLFLVGELQACDGLASAIPYSVLTARTQHLLARPLEAGSAAAARALGCDVVVTERALDDEHALLAFIEGVGPLDPPAHETDASRPATRARLALLDDARPLLAVALRPTLVDEASALSRVLSSTTAAEQAAVVDDPLARLDSPALPSGEGVARAELTSAGPDRATIALTGSGGAVVVWRRAFAAGWRAEQEGRALPVVRASATSLAVVVDDVARGPVSLAYVPPLRARAVAVSLAGVLLVGLALARRRAREPTVHAT